MSAFFSIRVWWAFADALCSSRSFFVAEITAGSTIKVIAPVFEISMCIVNSISPAAPLAITTFSVSGVLQIAIMFPASSSALISRMVKPPTDDGTIATTSIMFGESSLTETLLTGLLQHGFFKAVIFGVG